MEERESNIIGELKCLTGLSLNQVDSVFRNLSHMLCMGNYYNGEEITIPYFGTFKLKFDGDDEDRKAQVTGFFSLSESIKRNVGIIEDFKETGDEKNLLDLDSYKDIRNDTRLALKNAVER